MKALPPVHRWRRPGSAEQLAHLTARSLWAVTSAPSALVLAILFPALFLAINVEALDVASRIRGFPTDDMADFAIALAFLQGALFSAVIFSTDLAGDIENGFIDRIALAPVSAATVLLSRILAVASFALLQVACFVAVGGLWGASLAAGAQDVPALLGIVVLINVAVAVVGFQVALRSGSGEMTQALFPIFFVLLLMSSALMPRDLMDIDWYRTVADVNPVSHMIEAIRSLYVSDGPTLSTGAALAFVLAVAGALASMAQMRTLLARHR